MFGFLLEQHGVLGQMTAALPPCYSQELDACITEFETAERENRQPAFCETLYPLWQDGAAWDAAMAQLPFCPVPTAAAATATTTRSSSAMGMLVPLLIGSAVGYGIALAMR